MQPDLALQIFYFVILIISIILHEVAHGYAANALGDPTAKLQGRLTLNPAPHIDPIGSILVPLICVLSPGGFLFGWAKPVPYNPFNLRNRRWGEAIVGFAGVATNLFIAGVFAMAVHVAAGQGMEIVANLAAIVVLVNLYLGFFNLIPFPPLDGYTVLRGILPGRLAVSFRRLEEQLMAGGFVTLIIFLLVFSYFLAPPFSAFVFSIFDALVGSAGV